MTDQEILKQRTKARKSLEGPLVGDYIKMRDGTLRRFTHDWGDSIQVTPPDHTGSFYLHDSGLADYSGSLDPSIPKEKIKPLTKKQRGSFWFFHNNEQRAHNGITVEVLCKIYKEQ